MALNKFLGITISIVVVCVFFAAGLLVMQGIWEQTEIPAVPGNITNYTVSNITFLANNTANLTLDGSPVVQSSVVSYNDTYMGFDGVNDEVNASADVPSIGSGEFTLSAWLKGTDLTSQGTALFIGRQVGNEGVSLFKDSSPAELVLNIYGQSQPDVPSVNISDVHDGQWHSVIGTGNSSGLYLYIDGVLGNSTNYTGQVIGTDLMYVGSVGESSYYPGQIDEVRIYNRSLTPSEVTEVYDSGRYLANESLPSDDLQVWYSFNEGTGSTLYDKSGNERNGI